MSSAKPSNTRNRTSSASAGSKQAKSGAATARNGAAKANGAAKTNGAARTTGKSGSAAARPVASRPAGQNRPAQQNRKARDRARARELAAQAEAAAAEPEASGPPLWVQLVTLGLSIFGLGVSIYLTIEHFTGNKTLACSVNSVFNCGAVTTSSESMVFGVFPVAVLGLAFFAFMVPVNTPWVWRARRFGWEIGLLRLASTVVGVGFILYLIFVELVEVNAICEWCTSVHIATFLLFVTVSMAAAVWGLPKREVRTR